MQANKHNTYNSSYNTQVVATQSRVEIAEGKQTQPSPLVEPTTSDRVPSCVSIVADGSFDFAGLAG
ncbi:MAG: hypothetical protein JKX81_01765 [Arenicella sp.]|nr:hypothetical protein [Arenicella sp.]